MADFTIDFLPPAFAVFSLFLIDLLNIRGLAFVISRGGRVSIFEISGDLLGEEIQLRLNHQPNECERKMEHVPFGCWFTFGSRIGGVSRLHGSICLTKTLDKTWKFKRPSMRNT